MSSTSNHVFNSSFWNYFDWLKLCPEITLICIIYIWGIISNVALLLLFWFQIRSKQRSMKWWAEIRSCLWLIREVCPLLRPLLWRYSDWLWWFLWVFHTWPPGQQVNLNRAEDCNIVDFFLNFWVWGDANIMFFFSFWQSSEASLFPKEQLLCPTCGLSIEIPLCGITQTLSTQHASWMMRGSCSERSASYHLGLVCYSLLIWAKCLKHWCINEC